MTDIRHIFFDIGGVLATNGWDSAQRARAIERFGIDAADFQHRHEEMVGPLETGEVTLDEYLDVTVFCRPRDLPRRNFGTSCSARTSRFPSRSRSRDSSRLDAGTG